MHIFLQQQFMIALEMTFGLCFTLGFQAHFCDLKYSCAMAINFLETIWKTVSTFKAIQLAFLLEDLYTAVRFI